MPIRYLLDTNTASYIIKGTVPSVQRRLTKVPMAQLAISTVTEGELRYGLARRLGECSCQTIVHEFSSIRLMILSWDSEAAQEYGQIRAALERELVQPMGNLDMMIGAHALALDLILVTNDQAFRRIKKLKIEDWTKS